MRRGLLTFLLAGAALVAAPAAQQPASPAPGRTAAPGQDPAQPAPPVSFRVEIDYVEVDAVVTDERGNLVQGLTREDFEVFEDGKPQKVALFTQVVIPVEKLERSLSESRPIVPDVKSNQRPFDGRAVCAGARRLPHGRAPQRAGETRGAAVHRPLSRCERHCRRHPHERPPRRLAGVHERSAPAQCRRGQVHGAEAAVPDARAARRVQPPAEHAADQQHRRRHRWHERHRP